MPLGPARPLASISAGVSTSRRSGARSPRRRAAHGGRQPAQEERVPSAPQHGRERAVVEPQAEASVAGPGSEGDRVAAQARRDARDVSQDRAPGARLRARAHQADRAARRRELVQPERVVGERVGAAQHDRADVLRVAARVGRHHPGRIRVAPQVQPLDAECGAHRVDVIGHRGDAIRADAGAQLATARTDRRRRPRGRRDQPERHITQCVAGDGIRAAGAARIDDQQLAPVEQGAEGRRQLRRKLDRRPAAGRAEQRAERRARLVAAGQHGERDRRRPQRRIRGVERNGDAAALRAELRRHVRTRRERRSRIPTVRRRHSEHQRRDERDDPHEAVPAHDGPLSSVPAPWCTATRASRRPYAQPRRGANGPAGGSAVVSSAFRRRPHADALHATRHPAVGRRHLTQTALSDFIIQT